MIANRPTNRWVYFHRMGLKILVGAELNWLNVCNTVSILARCCACVCVMRWGRVDVGVDCWIGCTKPANRGDIIRSDTNQPNGWSRTSPHDRRMCQMCVTVIVCTDAGTTLAHHHGFSPVVIIFAATVAQLHESVSSKQERENVEYVMCETTNSCLVSGAAWTSLTYWCVSVCLCS